MARAAARADIPHRLSPLTAQRCLSVCGRQSDHHPLALGCPILAVDAYMNVQLLDSSEYVDGTLAGELGEILIRCNNVMYVTAAPEEGDMEVGA